MIVDGDKIREKRIKLNYSQEELGDKIGVTKVSICGYEAGSKTPTLKKFLKISDVLGLSPNELLNRNIKVVREDDEPYGFRISEKEMALIISLRKNETLMNQLYKKMNIN